MIRSLKQIAFRKFKKVETEIHELSYLFWECTTRCNLSCIHCGSDCSRDSSTKDMPLEDFLKALDTIEAPPANFIVVLTGGEPLLRKDIEQIGFEIRKRGVMWSMVTNGMLYDNERHISLLNAGLGALTISLDGLEANHNWMRNSPRAFARVDNAIGLAATSARINFDVVTCVNSRNLHELSKIRDYLIGKGVRSWRLFTIVPIGRAKDNPSLFLSDLEFVELMDFIAINRKNRLIDVKFSCEGYVGKYESKVRDCNFFCRAGINIASVLIDGSISACPNIDRTFSQGNIYKDNLSAVWHGKFQPFRDRSWTKRGKCAVCSEYRDCLGNGFHNWHGDMQEVLVCHYGKLNNYGNER